MTKNKLHNIKENGFKIPLGYFDSLEDNIMSDLKLKNLTKNAGFKAPNNYFNSVEDTILHKVSNTKIEPKVITLLNRKTILYATSVAAAVLLLLNLSLFESKPTFENLDNNTVENYILNENIDSYELASLLDEEDLNEEDFIEFNFDEKVIEDYIFDELNVQDLY